MSALAAWINTGGILLVAGGSVLVAFEVVQRFKGEKYQTTTQVSVASDTGFTGGLGGKITGVSRIRAKDSPEYEKWEKTRNVVMAVGLGLILMGSAVQIWASWIDV